LYDRRADYDTIIECNEALLLGSQLRRKFGGNGSRTSQWKNVKHAATPGGVNVH